MLKFKASVLRLIPALYVGMLGVVVQRASAVTLFDSGGFESSAGYSAGPSGSGANLYGQPTTGQTWTQFVNEPDSATSYLNASVYAYTTPSAGNAQYVGIYNYNTEPGDYGYFWPQGYTSPNAPYTPAPNEEVVVQWTMEIGNSAGDPFFGIAAQNNGVNFALAGIDGTTGAPQGLTQISDPSFNAAVNSYYSYELLLDFDTQSYALYELKLGIDTTYSLVGTSGFTTPSSAFSDAALTTFLLQSSTNGNAFAVVDDYEVTTETVPEPACLSGLGLALVLLRRKRPM